MRRSPRTVFYMLIAIAALLLGTIHQVEAAFKMQLTSGGSTTTISDNGSGDLSWFSTGVITFSGMVGDFAVYVTLGSSKPVIGSPTNPMLNITSFTATSAAGGTLDIALSDTDFGPVGPSAVFRTDLNGTLVPGTIAAKTYFVNGNADFTMANLVGNISPLTGVSSGSDSQIASPGTPFSINMIATIMHTGAGATSFDATTRVGVPEPSATLCLGITLFGIAGYTGWQRRKTTI